MSGRKCVGDVGKPLSPGEILSAHRVGAFFSRGASQHESDWAGIETRPMSAHASVSGHATSPRRADVASCVPLTFFRPASVDVGLCRGSPMSGKANTPPSQRARYESRP